MIVIINWTDSLRTSLNINEMTACHKAFHDCILPRLSSVDKSLFKDILQDNFPEVNYDNKNVDDAIPILKEVMKDHKMSFTDAIVNKTYEMHVILKNYRSLILIGQAGIGKSSILKMYKDFMSHPNNPKQSNVNIS